MDAFDVVTKMFNVWEKDGMISGYEEYMHPDIVYINSGLPDQVGKTIVLDNLRSYVNHAGMPFVRVDVKNIVARGNMVVVERVDNMFSKESNKKHSLPVMGIFRIEDSLIREFRDYFDPREILASLEGSH